MKTVELRRHTDNDGDQLTTEGVAAAEEIGLQLRPPYDVFVSSGAGRATQTLEIWRTALRSAAPLEEQPALRSQREDRWREAYRAAGSGAIDAMRAVDPGLVDEQAQTLGAALRWIFDRLPDGGRALAVGHSPTNEAAVLGLTGELIAPLGKGDGVVLIEDSGRYRVEPT